jgi:tetratricopeptide (TPR) repeat protein
VTARAARLVLDGADGCPDAAQALSLGRVYERAGSLERAEACYRKATAADALQICGEGWYRLGLKCRRDRRFAEAADAWRAILAITESSASRKWPQAPVLRQFAVEALAIHHEHRARDLHAARELALFGLEDEPNARRADGYRHRLARLDRKIAKKQSAQLFWN